MANDRTPGIIRESQLQLDGATLARVNAPKPGCSCSLNSEGSPPHRCLCSGDEKSRVTGLPMIPSYTGDLPSPLQIMWYFPGADELTQSFYPDTQIRRWVREAADYHGIPHLLLAVILQQENAPSASTLRKIGQFGERSLTTFLDIVDRSLWDIVPDKLAGGSSGFANMSRATLLDAASYTQLAYCKKLMPDSVRYRALGFNSDTRISGDDWKNDLYYCAAHLRQLIDRSVGRPCHHGTLSLDELKAVIRQYNGSGPKAEKYAEDAMRTLNRAATAEVPLYFYEE